MRSITFYITNYANMGIIYKYCRQNVSMANRSFIGAFCNGRRRRPSIPASPLLLVLMLWANIAMIMEKVLVCSPMKHFNRKGFWITRCFAANLQARKIWNSNSFLGWRRKEGKNLISWIGFYGNWSDRGPAGIATCQYDKYFVDGSHMYVVYVYMNLFVIQELSPR